VTIIPRARTARCKSITTSTACAARNRVDRMFGKHKNPRRINARYDNTALPVDTFLNLAAAPQWLESFVTAT